MNTIKKITAMEDVKINVKIKLSALWIAMMLLYIYADILSLIQTGSGGGNVGWTNGTLSCEPRFVVNRLNIDDHSCRYGFPILDIET